MDTRQREHFKELRQIYQRRLDILQKQAAGFGLYAPPHVLLEIEDIKQKLADIDVRSSSSSTKSTKQQSSRKANGVDQKRNLDANLNVESNRYGSLYEKLVTSFNDEDIRTLCFSLNIDYDNLPASGKANKVRELIIYCIRNEYLEQLKEKCRRSRPKVNWD